VRTHIRASPRATRPRRRAALRALRAQLQGFCRARLSSREEAEDAVQHTFLNAYRSLRNGTRPRARLPGCSRSPRTSAASGAARRGGAAGSRSSRTTGSSATARRRSSSHEELTGVADALAELTPNQRRAILMREWQGLSYREIAAELSLTEGAVETLLFRARRSLAHKLDRSRGRVWGISNLGSALAWGKTLLGGPRAGRSGGRSSSRRRDRRFARSGAPSAAAAAEACTDGVHAAAPAVRSNAAAATTRPSSASSRTAGRPRRTTSRADARDVRPPAARAPGSTTSAGPTRGRAPAPPGDRPRRSRPLPPAPQLPKVEVRAGCAPLPGRRVRRCRR
jgi:DNA-directed RNA polymerase specialized sigma24 family protein